MGGGLLDHQSPPTHTLFLSNCVLIGFSSQCLFLDLCMGSRFLSPPLPALLKPRPSLGGRPFLVGSLQLLGWKSLFWKQPFFLSFLALSLLHRLLWHPEPLKQGSPIFAAWWPGWGRDSGTGPRELHTQLHSCKRESFGVPLLCQWSCTVAPGVGDPCLIRLSSDDNLCGSDNQIYKGKKECVPPPQK